MISSRSVGRGLILLTLAAGGCKGSSDGGSAVSVDAGAAENMVLDAAAFRSLAERPYRYHELTQTKTQGADARTTRTYPAVGLRKQQVEVQIVERQHSAWSLHFAATKAKPAQFGKVDVLFSSAVAGATTTWYRVGNDALEGCYLLARETGAATDITIVSPDFVTLDQGSDERALAEWLSAHPQDAGHG